VSDFTDEKWAEAAKALDAICGPLAIALERLALTVAALDPDAAKAGSKMLLAAEGNEWDQQAFAIVQKALEKRIAKHLARTADYLFVLVGQNANGTWSADISACGDAVQSQTFQTFEEAKAAGDALNSFMSLRGACEYEWEVPKGKGAQHADLPF